MENGGEQYSYTSAGFSSFLTRSIDDSPATNLDSLASSVQQVSREVNYDQSPTTGQLGSVLQIGNIQIDGARARITIFDDKGNEVVWIGDISG